MPRDYEKLAKLARELAEFTTTVKNISDPKSRICIAVGYTMTSVVLTEEEKKKLTDALMPRLLDLTSEFEDAINA